MRRYREMSAMGGGMNFYGEIPAMYNITVNMENPLISRIMEAKGAHEGELEAFAADNQMLRQVTDLALLANGMLKGKDLSDFIARSAKVYGLVARWYIAMEGLSDQVEKFVASALVTKENSAEGRCGGYCIGLLHTSKCHAGVGCLDDNSHSKWIESILDTVADLCRESFLNLQTTGEGLDHSGNLAQSGNLSIRDICNVGLTDERHHVMLAGRVEFDILHEHHLLIFLLEHCTTKNLRPILMRTMRQELKSLCDTLRCLDQTLTLRILSQELKNLLIMCRNRCSCLLVVVLYLIVCHIT